MQRRGAKSSGSRKKRATGRSAAGRSAAGRSAAGRSAAGRSAAGKRRPPLGREPECLGLLLASGFDLKTDAEALRLAQAIATRVLGKSWRVTALGAGARDYRVRSSTTRLTVGRA